MDVSKLEGAELDAAVARAQGRACRVVEMLSEDYRCRFDACLIANTHGWDKRTTDFHVFNPSHDWRDGGPLIERERISLTERVDHWVADVRGASEIGPTPLIAAMRAYAASREHPHTDKPKAA